jgi:hypothetical protein
MPILPNSIYRGVIHRARLETLEKKDGGVTSSLKVRVKVPSEAEPNNCIDHNLYFTPNALAQTKKVVSELNSDIWEGTYPYLLREPEKFLKGRECKIETELHEFTTQGGAVERSVRVKWLNGITEAKAATEGDVTRILGMMGVADEYVAPEATEVAKEVDGDTPF